MNGKVQGIIICGVIAASLAGMLVFLNATDKDKNKKEESSSAETVSSAAEMEHYFVLEKGEEEIASIKAENENGGFTLDKPSSGKSSWTVEEIISVNQNRAMKENMISECGYLEASKIAEEGAQELSKYGLEEPRASFEVGYTDGTSKKVLIGDVAPEAKYTYIKTEDGGTVYMILSSRISDMLKGAKDFANLSLIEKPVNNEDWPEYGKEVITRSDWDYQVVFENDPNEDSNMLSSQVISEPIFSYLNITGSGAVTHGMWGLTAASCEAVAPTDEQLAEHGISEPRCVVSLKGEGYDYTLKVGGESYSEAAEGETPVLQGYYCTLDGVSGSNAVYVIAAENLPWVTFKIEDVTSNLITSNYLVDLANMSVTIDGKETLFEITTNGGSNDKDENGKAADVTSVKTDGKELDIGLFKDLYQFIMSCPTNEICFDDPEGSPAVIIKQVRKDGGEDVVELYKDTSRRYIVKLNDKTSFRIQSTWVDSLDTNIGNLKNGKNIDNNY